MASPLFIVSIIICHLDIKGGYPGSRALISFVIHQFCPGSSMFVASKWTKGLMVSAKPVSPFAIIRPSAWPCPLFYPLITEVARRREPIGSSRPCDRLQIRHVAQSGWILRGTAELVRQAQCGEVSALGNLGTFRQAPMH